MIKKIVSFLIGVVLTVFLCFTFFKSPFKDNLNISIVETFLESEVYVISAEYPQFNLVDDNFNKEIEKCVLERIDSFKENATSNWSARGEAYPAPLYFEAVWEPVQINKDYISFVINVYSFEGGAHGNTEVYTFNYDIGKQERIDFKSFINNSDEILNKVSEIAILEIEERVLENDDEFFRSVIAEGAGPELKNYKNFTFTKNKLIIYFDKYQVAPGVFGIIKTEIYFDQIGVDKK